MVVISLAGCGATGASTSDTENAHVTASVETSGASSDAPTSSSDSTADDGVPNGYGVTYNDCYKLATAQQTMIDTVQQWSTQINDGVPIQRDMSVMDAMFAMKGVATHIRTQGIGSFNKTADDLQSIGSQFDFVSKKGASATSADLEPLASGIARIRDYCTTYISKS